MNPQGSPSKPGWGWELAAWLVAVAGVAVRCLPWRFVFTGSGVFLPGVDPYYHLWHARNLIEQFPHWSLMDAYLNFPAGAPAPYLKGFDLLVALPGLIGGSTGPLAPWSAFMMPLLGGVAVYLTYRVGRSIFGPACGLLAAVLMASMCGAMNYTMLGRVDHHGAVAPVILSMFLCLLKSLQSTNRRRIILWGALCGLLAGWSVTLWVITPPLYYLPVPLALVWLCLRGQGPGVRLTALTTSVAAVLAVALAVWLTGDLQARPFELFLPSWIPIIAFGLAALWVSIAVWRPGWSLVLPGAILVLAFLSAGLGLFEIQPFPHIVGVLGGGSTAFADIVESQPLLSVDGVFTLDRAVAFYSHLFLLWPVLAGVLTFRIVRAKNPPAGEVLLILFILLAGVLLMLQQRFGEYAAPAMALLMAWALAGGGRILLGYVREPGRGVRPRIFSALLVVALGLSLYPLVGSLARFASHDTVGRSRLLAEFGEELSATTPDPVGADGRPTYGLLTSEEDAVVLLASSKRPVVVSSFGLDEIQEYNREGYRILLAGDEDWALRRIERLQVRYLVVSSIVMRVESMARVAGLRGGFVDLEKNLEGPNMRVSARPLPPFVGSLHTRLLVADGSRKLLWGIGAPELGHFRLHLESEEIASVLGIRVPALKAFEVVAGARLVGRSRPGETVRLELAVRTNTGREFTYRARARADRDGRYEFVVPYATTGAPAPCHTLGPYRISAGERAVEVQVEPQAVLRGEEISVPSLDEERQRG